DRSGELGSATRHLGTAGARNPCFQLVDVYAVEASGARALDRKVEAEAPDPVDAQRPRSVDPGSLEVGRADLDRDRPAVLAAIAAPAAASSPDHQCPPLDPDRQAIERQWRSGRPRKGRDIGLQRDLVGSVDPDSVETGDGIGAR